MAENWDKHGERTTTRTPWKDPETYLFLPLPTTERALDLILSPGEASKHAMWLPSNDWGIDFDCGIEFCDDCLRHPRSKYPAPLLGRNHRRNGLCMHSRDCSESGAVHGMPRAHIRKSSTCDQTIDPVESNGPRSASHGYTRSGRGYRGLMNPHSPLQALAIDPGLSGRQKKSIVLIVSMKFSTRAGRAGWFGVDFVGHQV